MDQKLAEYAKTSDDHCDENEVCTRAVAYWDKRGRIQKSVQEVRSKAGPGTVTGRYFDNCRLILVRITPNDTEAVKDPRKIEKYYFRKGILLRVTFGDQIQNFSKDQMVYYQRTYGQDPKVCRQPTP